MSRIFMAFVLVRYTKIEDIIFRNFAIQILNICFIYFWIKTL